MTLREAATHTFADGFNCAQAVLSTYAEPLGLERATALKFACPFGGGIARTGQTCEAVSGALMVIGLKHGMADAADQPAYLRSHYPDPL